MYLQRYNPCHPRPWAQSLLTTTHIGTQGSLEHGRIEGHPRPWARSLLTTTHIGRQGSLEHGRQEVYSSRLIRMLSKVMILSRACKPCCVKHSAHSRPSIGIILSMTTRSRLQSSPSCSLPLLMNSNVALGSSQTIRTTSSVGRSRATSGAMGCASTPNTLVSFMIPRPACSHSVPQHVQGSWQSARQNTMRHHSSHTLDRSSHPQHPFSDWHSRRKQAVTRQIH